MTLDEVKARLDAINAAKGDPEVAHGMEDTLWLDVLTFLADRGEPLAGLAIKSRGIEFDRWYA